MHFLGGRLQQIGLFFFKSLGEIIPLNFLLSLSVWNFFWLAGNLVHFHALSVEEFRIRFSPWLRQIEDLSRREYLAYQTSFQAAGLLITLW